MIYLIVYEGAQQECMKKQQGYDDGLKKELDRHEIGELYEKFHNAKVKVNILWTLDDELIKFCNLNPIEKKLYEIAKRQQSGSWY